MSNLRLQHDAKGIAYGLASAILFGNSTPIAKILVGSVSPVMLAGLLYAGSGPGLLLLLVLRRMSAKRPVSISTPRGNEWGWLAPAILLGNVLGPVALMYGLATTAASTASLLLNLEAVFTALIAWFLFRENFDRRIALGMVAIVAGGVALAWPAENARNVSSGTLFIAVACGCWALDNNLTRKTSTAGALMAYGVWLHVTERHAHEHDEHHQHAHDVSYGPEPHAHLHVHKPLVHSHPHYPDVHHRHPH